MALPCPYSVPCHPPSATMPTYVDPAPLHRRSEVSLYFLRVHCHQHRCLSPQLPGQWRVQGYNRAITRHAAPGSFTSSPCHPSPPSPGAPQWSPSMSVTPATFKGHFTDQRAHVPTLSKPVQRHPCHLQAGPTPCLGQPGRLSPAPLMPDASCWITWPEESH